MAKIDTNLFHKEMALCAKYNKYVFLYENAVLIVYVLLLVEYVHERFPDHPEQETSEHMRNSVNIIP